MWEKRPRYSLYSMFSVNLKPSKKDGGNNASENCYNNFVKDAIDNAGGGNGGDNKNDNHIIKL